MRVGSLFTGIGGFDLGYEQAGMGVAWQCEIDKAARRVLARHWPGVPCYEDVTQINGSDVQPVDLLVGGFPCQDVSVAGRRAGLAGKRSGLFYEFARLIDQLAPQWVVIENVPGLLSSRGGRDMGAVLGTLAELGYGFAYRVLDAQYFGVPQRRRRVFIVGCLGDGARAGEVLFEPEGLRQDSPPSREAGPYLAIPTTASTLQGGGERGYRIDAEAAAGGHLLPVYNPHRTYVGPGEWVEGWKPDHVHDALTATTPPKGPPVTVTESSVRRLTPLECERLQGFPDDWTAGESDAQRYRQLGNAVCVPVAEWLGLRLMAAAVREAAA